KLAEMEKARIAAEEAARLAEAAKIKEEEKRLLAEEKSKRDSELAIAKQAEELRKLEAQKAKDEEKRLADELKAKEAAELAAAKEEEANRKADIDRLAAEQKAKQQAELAAQKVAEEKALAEKKRLADEAKAEEEARKVAEAKAQADKERVEAEEKARKEAELAAAKAAEEERKVEEKRQAELAKQRAEQDEKQRLANYESLVIKGDGAYSNKEYELAMKNYQDAKQLYPDSKDLMKKMGDTEVQIDRLEKEQADRLALDQKFNGLLEEGESALSEENYNEALRKFEEASALKPNEQAPKQKIKDANSALAQLALAEKEKQANERKFVLLMQEGNSAFSSNDLVTARSKYEEANSLKPQDDQPKSKLLEITNKEQELALADMEKRKKEEEAKKKFEEQLRLDEEKKAKELQARIDAINQATSTTSTNADEARIEKYERLKETIEKLDMKAEEQRKAFLSELAKIYPQGMTKEQVDGKNFVLLRYVINENNVVTIYEKKTWDWGGVFYFKDSDIAITEAIYKLEIGKY
ncbi:MAG: hypothetical protein K9G41_03345, partial [Flavobacteriales bacterium]|nr:hypothetical protein [Flavobacteriales bacterium]